MSQLCIYFNPEVSGHLTDTESYLKDYDGICLRRRKDILVKRSMCLGGCRCKRWADKLPAPKVKKERRYYEEY